MDFENQFTRPMIHALGSRMAILKMESVCDKPNAKFQQGFELGFEEAFNFIREFGRADELIKRLDAREKIKKAAERAKVSGIAQVTAVQGKDIEPTPVTDEKIQAIPAFAGPLSDAEKIEQNLQTLMDAAGVPDLRAAPMETFHKSIADWPDLANEEAVGDKVEVEEKKPVDGVPYFKFIVDWIAYYDHVSRDLITSEYILRDSLQVSDFVTLMKDAYNLFGNKKCYEIDDFKNLVTVYDLGVYLAEHLERTNTFQPSDDEIKKSGVMKYVCEKMREVSGDWTLENDFLSGSPIRHFANMIDVANIVNDAELKFRRDPSTKQDRSDIEKLYEGTVFDLAKYIVERVNDKV